MPIQQGRHRPAGTTPCAAVGGAIAEPTVTVRTSLRSGGDAPAALALRAESQARL
ncbi:MAG: hypothetical protein MJ202_07100 [Lentisphaeria bacterium]|nr:hypothetical protein [Lentisphaeria bacterium]